MTIVLTIVLGRVFCGWVCPLGAVHQFSSFVFKKTKFLRPPREEKASVATKYYILVFVLVSAVFTLDLVGLLDPFSFLYRSFAVAVFPGLTHAGSALVGALYGLKFEAAAQPVSQWFQKLSVNATFHQGLFMFALFALAVGLNAKKERFWCRYVCPLGALLGLFSRWNVFKVRVNMDKCIKCNLCTMHCQTQAVPYPNEKWRSAECVYCGTCAAICPTAAITYPATAKPEKLDTVDLSRRKLILTTAARAPSSRPLFSITPTRKRANLKLIRPPGALPEEDFVRKCVKCGECMKACPTNALQPALFEAGPEGLWTPMLVPVIGYCEYYCSLCSQVCPTGAIRKLKIEEKTPLKIGSAWIKKDRCIPYALGRALHRLRGALPDLAQGHQVRDGRDEAPRRERRDAEGPRHRQLDLHRLRDLREQVPGRRRPGHLRDLGRRGPLEDQPAPAPDHRRGAQAVAAGFSLRSVDFLGLSATFQREPDRHREESLDGLPLNVHRQSQSSGSSS